MKKSAKMNLFVGLASVMALGVTSSLRAEESGTGASPVPNEAPPPAISETSPTVTETSPAITGTSPAVTELSPAVTEGSTAPEKTTPPSPSEETSTVVTGKIVLVDRAAQTITLEVNGKFQQFKVGPRVKMVKQGRLAGLRDLAPGQQVAVLSKVGAKGNLEVVALSVEPSTTRIEAADAGGQGKGLGGGEGGGRVNAAWYPGPTPFASFPNPANNMGPVRSPEQ